MKTLCQVLRHPFAAVGSIESAAQLAVLGWPRILRPLLSLTLALCCLHLTVLLLLFISLSLIINQLGDVTSGVSTRLARSSWPWILHFCRCPPVLPSLGFAAANYRP